jgi:hypothetical protein
MGRCAAAGIAVLMANPKEPIDKVARQIIKRFRAASAGKE